MNKVEYDRPLPEITASSKPFWDGTKKHKLMVYQCQNCGARYFPATDCMICDNPKMEWSEVSGHGKVYSFIIYYTNYHTKWKKHVPYNVAWIKLDEGPIIMSNIVNCQNKDIYIDMPVEVVFDDVTSEITLPKFIIARISSNS
jgi:uncharacterized OB-fold protein